jgi:adenylosuccinate lyase
MNKIPAATLSQAFAITPLDGRNHLKIKELSEYFSEYALNRYRTKIELEYLLKLSTWKVIRKLSLKETSTIMNIYSGFDSDGYLEIKMIEEETNHDIKAIEYFLKHRFEESGLKDLTPYLHLGLTSEDTNNLAYGLMLKDFHKDVIGDELKKLITRLLKMSKQFKTIPMLARTHGQPAVATSVGKELANYCYRLSKLQKKLGTFKFEGKLNGAVGNLNAHKAIMPEADWLKRSREFVEGLGLVPNPYTTQILFYDNWMEYFQRIYMVNAVLIDLSVNVWQSIMLNIFTLKIKGREVGSSTMPQKVNPINFEHAEGNLQLANAMLEFFIRKLTSSRLQRDLSDSTVRRNFGEALGYTTLGWRSVGAGLEKIDANEKYLRNELDHHWETLGEAIQTALRLKGDKDGYEKIKQKTRGRVFDEKLYKELIKDLGLGDDVNLINLSPDKYMGYAKELVDKLKI